MDKIQSQLGDIEIEEERFSRKKEGDWENILEEYPEEKIIDEAHFKDITGLKLEKDGGSINPCIKIQIDNEEWKYLFFQVNDPIQKIWANLRYKWQAFLQNHSSEFVRE
jgi:hypothetical protein